MNKNKKGRRRSSIKYDYISINAQIFKYRNATDIFPASRPKIKENPVEIKSNNNQKDKDKKKDVYDLNEEFLFALTQPIFLLDKQKMNNTISKLINESELINKIKNDLETTESLNVIMNTFIKNLTFKMYEKDFILYRTGETDNKFYFILKGRISALKPKKIISEISFDDYILYLIKLKQNNEINLLNKVIKLNANVAPIKSIEDIQRIDRIIFKRKLNTILTSEDSEDIIDNDDLDKFFKEYYQDYNYYNITQKELKKLIVNRGKIVLGVVNKEWDDYILEHCKLTTDDNLYFEPFEAIFKQNNYPFSIYTYEYGEEFIGSDYFGDFSLDEDKVIRNETMRFEEDSTLFWITIDDYIDIISPQKKIEKKNDIMRLNNSFCFKDISERVFKRNYYQLFQKKYYSRNSIIFRPDTKSKYLYFIKTGKLALQLNYSIIELQQLLELIFDKLNNVPLSYENYQKKYLPRERLKMLEFKYLDDSIIKNMKTHSELFKKELEKKRSFQIAVFSDFEMVGLEEVYLQIPHFSKAIVIGDNFCFNELPINKFNIILKNEMRNIRESYVQVSINRILTLIKRIFDIKENFMSMAKLKSNIDGSHAEKKIEDSNNEYNFSNLANRKINLINNNKTNLPQINFAQKDINNNKLSSENNIKEFFKKTKINSPKRRKLTLKSAYSRKSARKTRNRKLILEIDENNKERAKSGKYAENDKRKEEEDDKLKIKNKPSNIIIIGNKKINIKELRKKINDKANKKDSENSNEIKKKENNINKQKLTNLIYPIEKNIISERITTNKNLKINKEKLKSVKTTMLKKQNLLIKISENDNFKNNKNDFSLLKVNNNIINNYRNKMNTFIPMTVNSIDPTLFNNNYSLDAKLTTNNNINTNENNINIINTSSNISNNENNKLSILPKIIPKFKSNNIFNNSSNSNSINNYSNRNKSSGKIPDIVKNYYSQIKQKGYIPLIVNKRSNTIFLRKYHKKYNES